MAPGEAAGKDRAGPESWVLRACIACEHAGPAGYSIERWADVKLRKRYLPVAAVLGAAVAIVPALAAAGPSEVKLEVNNNCDEPNWPCWTRPGESPSYTPSVTIASGGVVAFSDELGKAANIVWTSTPSGPPTCSPEVPVSPVPAKTGWEGKCTFEEPGIYGFESSTLFDGGPSLNYTKYEVVVEGASTGTTSTTTATTTPTATTTTTTTPTTHTTTVPTATVTATSSLLATAPSEAKLEVNENCVQPEWPCWATPGSGSPAPASKVTIATGGEVVFTDNANTKANIAWMGTAPACSPSVPVSPAAPRAPWEGRCRFEQPGTYRFESSTLFNGGPSLNYTEYEIVVEGAGTGATPTTMTTTTTPTTTTVAPTTPSEPSHGSPLEGARALKLAGSQRGSAVRGSIEVSQAGAGGRLEVGLFATGASLAKAGHPARVRVGRLVRSSLQAGSVSFSVPLSAKGKAALRRHRRLALTVKITLTPLRSAAVTVTRVVVLHA
jgi:hypothetical protein